MRVSLRIIAATAAGAAAVAAVPLMTTSDARAAGFTGGDVVVYRVGSTGSALSNAAAPVFLDEYSPAGTLVQSIALPTTAADGNLPLTAAGESRSEGLLSRSPDGRFLAVTGYGAAPGATGPNGSSLTSSAPSSVARVVGLVDGHGNVDTSTALSGASAPQIIRSALTVNGDQAFAAGGNGGVLQASLGSATTSVVAGTDQSNLNSLTDQAGSLYVSGILTDRLATVAGSKLTDLTGLPSNLLTYGYAVLDLDGNGSADTLYLADSSARGGTVDKYHASGTGWTSAGSVDVPGATGLVADVKGGVVSLMVTTPTSLLNLTDPAGSAATFTPAAATTVATAATGTEFRGVALAPTATAGPSLFVRSPARSSAVSIVPATVTVTAYVPGGASGVTASIGAGTASAVKGSGNLWVAHVPTSQLKAGPATLSVAATSATGTTTRTRPITLTGTSTPTVPAGALTAGRHAPSESKVKRTGVWKAYTTSTSPTRKGLTASKRKSALTASVYGKKLVVALTTGPKAGKVAISVDGRSSTVDLYGKKSKTRSVTYSFAGALKAHPVKLTVLGSKSKHSLGTAVYVAELTVS